MRKGTEYKRLSPSSRIKGFFTENVAGKILVDIAGSNIGLVHNKRCEDNLLVLSTQILLALRAYKTESGKHPSSLHELVPRYISGVPTDPFNGKPLRYSLDRKIFYSVGTDFVDSGGKETEKPDQKGDMVFRINF